MGVGDRHSKRTDRSRIAIPAIRSLPPAHAVDDRELDDPFSAWDDDDAGAHRPAPAATAPTRIERKPARTPAAAPPASAFPTPPVLAEGSTRRATPLGEPLVDPVAMRDIVIARAQTLDDPLTSRVLTEIARKRTRSNVGIQLPGLAGAGAAAGAAAGTAAGPRRAAAQAAAQAAAAADPDYDPDDDDTQESPTTGRATVRIGMPRPPGAGARSGTRIAARPPESLAGPGAPPPSPRSGDARVTRDEMPAPGRRRPIARDEPFRKR